MNKVLIIAVGASAAILGLVAVVASKRISPLSWGWYGEIQRTGDGLAVHGYDPVAYFAGSAAPGRPEYRSEWRGATWRFSSAQNKATFDAEPAKYAPQFGGFCAYASSKSFTATVDPTAFRVEDGKLYLFNDASMRDKWAGELPTGVIEKARENWRKRPDPKN